jgi:hypothetical protein
MLTGGQKAAKSGALHVSPFLTQAGKGACCSDCSGGNDAVYFEHAKLLLLSGGKQVRRYDMSKNEKEDNLLLHDEKG